LNWETTECANQRISRNISGDAIFSDEQGNPIPSDGNRIIASQFMETWKARLGPAGNEPFFLPGSLDWLLDSQPART